jgi:hypothetical protein
VGVLLPGCSTAAPEGLVQECSNDDDCEAGEVCLLDQGGVCIDLSVPARRPELGLDVTQNQFRIEFRGCDAELDPIDGVLRTDKRDQLSTINQVSAISERPTIECAACPDGECIDGDLCRFPFRGEFTLSQPSRFGQSGLKLGPEPYPIEVEMVEVADPVVFEWPRYVASDLSADLPVVLELVPEDTNLARVRRELAPAQDAGTREFAITTRLDCQRKVSAHIRRLETQSALPETAVALFFNEEVAELATTIGVPVEELPACAQTSECSPGHACAMPEGRCVLDLKDARASRSASSNESGDVQIPVYNYCEGGNVSERAFRVEVTPPDGSGLPVMHYDLLQPFAFPPVDSPVVDPLPDDLDLCLPDWAPISTLTLAYEGEPVKLLETEEGEYVCCSSECLPTAQEERPPSTASACPEISLEKFQVSTRVPDVDEQAWMDDGCLLPIAGDSGESVVVGACESGVCTVDLSPGEQGPDAPGLEYTLAIESPVGSVFRSQTLKATVVEGQTTFEPISLSPRVVYRGAVGCGDELGETCVPADVAIVAERLRFEGEADPAGPFFHETASLSDGTFTLLLDPGVYVVTAIPERGSAAGPSAYRVIDLRLGQGGTVDVVDGVPTADTANNPIELTGGVPVVLRLRDFDPGGRVEPIDLGSWAHTSPLVDPDGNELDLNDPLTCYGGGAADRGCLIRRMIRPGAPPILASISNSADFTMRVAGDVNCP